MREQNLRFGVLSTYKETIFPSQYTRGPKWSLEFPPPILHTSRGSATLHTVSLRQAFLWVARQAPRDLGFELVRHGHTQRWTL